VNPNYRVTFRKRKTGEIHTGTCYDDGLSSLIGVTTDQGEVVYLSVLDEVLQREQVAPKGPYAIAGDQRW
jgi:hypothetical protein